MTVQERFPKQRYEASVIGVFAIDRYSLNNCGHIVFLLDNDQVVTYHIKGVNKEATDVSLKTVGYFLDYPFSYGCKYYHKNLINRNCIVHIELKINNNKTEKFSPNIVGFEFSSKSLFKMNKPLSYI